MKSRFEIENNLINNFGSFVIGCDEVGRGSIAGPVVSSAVMFLKSFDSETWWNEIEDSKFLSEKKRQALNQKIKQNSIWATAVVSSKQIDQINILQATLLSMRKAVKSLLNKNPHQKRYITLLIDGNTRIPDLNLVQETIVGGDRFVHSIAAASIVAKVHRDNLMTKLHNLYPEYGLAVNKGYGTLKHRDSIKLHGLSPVHRTSFCGKIFDA